VSPKNVALLAAAVAVTGMAVYLFVQVKATPAQAEVSASELAAPTHASPAPVHTTEPTRPSAEARPAPPQPNVGASRPAASGAAPELQAAPESDEPQQPNPKLESMMQLANKAYDAQDFDQAIAIAGKILAKEPTNVRMLRIMVSANCIGGDATVAQQYYEKLPAGVDRQQMKTRCDRYQVTLKD
jgi:hypothetical protein